MGKVKGSSAIAVRNFVKEKYGDSGLAQVMAALPGETARVIAGAIPSAWIPTGMLKEFYVAANRLLGDGTNSFYRKVGANNARHDLPRFFKSVISLATPEMVFGLLGTVWKLYYDTGRIRIADRGKDYLTVEIEGFEDACDEICEDICGYCETLLALIKLNNPRVSHTKCASRGDHACIFEGRWDA